MAYRLVNVMVVVATVAIYCSAQAPGDEDADCTGAENAPTYPDTVKNLMDSYNYLQLLPDNGTGNSPIHIAVWNDRSFDGNDVISTLNPTFWQQGPGGICRFQVRVCGWERDGDQDNWLFTQHINQDFDPSIYNYTVEIKVEITYALQSCRERFGCKPRFTLHNYITNTMQLPSTSGSGFMNTQHYNSFAEVTPPGQLTHTELFHFSLELSDTGFYIAIRDNGTCVGVSRLRVYRNNCQSFQSGLVLYPEAPAPVSGSVNISISCVENAVVSGSPQVTCHSNGTWGGENPVCECRQGYEKRKAECLIEHTNSTSSLTPTNTERIFPTPTATSADLTSSSIVGLVAPSAVSTPATNIVGLVAGVTVSVGLLILGGIVVTAFIICWKSRTDPKGRGTHCFTRKTKSDIETSPDIIEMSALQDDMSSTPRSPFIISVRQSTPVQSTLVQSTQMLSNLEQQLIQELSDKNMIISRKQVELSNVVGQGESGLVYCGYYDGSSGRELVAVKSCKALSTISEKEKLLKEMTTMLSFTHPNVMSLIGLCFDGEMPLLIMPFMANDNVLGFVKKNKEQLHQNAKEVEVKTARKVCLDMCHQISKGMEYLAKQKFVHRDLAARNCMIDRDGVIKVADFGLTEDAYGANYFRRRKSVTGSEEKVPIKWMAPESIENDIYNERTDVWAFGVTCWEIFTCGRVPYAGIPTMTLVGELRNGYRLDRPSNAACSDEIWDIVMFCWCEQSQQRPKFTTLVKDFSKLLDSETNYLKLSQN